jgi:phosphotransferase system HPr-like phosphotransfer protein
VVSFQIQLRTIADVKDFLRVVSDCPSDIDLSSGRYVVDAKSVMGVFSLDLGKPLRVDVHDDACASLEQELARFLVQP